MRIKYESKLTNFMPQKGKRCREVYITADKDIRICCIKGLYLIRAVK